MGGFYLIVFMLIEISEGDISMLVALGDSDFHFEGVSDLLLASDQDITHISVKAFHLAELEIANHSWLFRNIGIESPLVEGVFLLFKGSGLVPGGSTRKLSNIVLINTRS